MIHPKHSKESALGLAIKEWSSWSLPRREYHCLLEIQEFVMSDFAVLKQRYKRKVVAVVRGIPFTCLILLLY
jgi:hypothetical protein